MYKGSCLCGAIHYEIRSELGTLYFCHCQRCRKANGSAFASNTQIPAESFFITQGEKFFKAFSTPAGVHRYFCAECGSPLISKRDSLPDIVRLRIGTLDTPINAIHKEHIYIDSKAEWDQILDDYPRHAGAPVTGAPVNPPAKN
jgi:hypothetical protein